MLTVLRGFAALAALFFLTITICAQPPAVQPTPADLLKQGQQLVREGRHDEALALYRQALEAAPGSFETHTQTGVLLDLLGRYADARAEFARAIELAATPEQTAQAHRSLAISYAFVGDCGGATAQEAPLYERHLAANDFYDAGEVADELARICLESGRLDEAERWYRTGYQAGIQEPDLTPARRDLWEFRWEHAQARIAARRGDRAAAARHVAAARAVLDKGTNPEQAVFFPYLTGYVAFYLDDDRTALEDLQKANQRDPFILSLLAQTCEKLGDRHRAMEYYRKVLTINIHNPTGAFARPLAMKKVGEAG